MIWASAGGGGFGRVPTTDGREVQSEVGRGVGWSVSWTSGFGRGFGREVEAEEVSVPTPRSYAGGPRGPRS